MEIIILFNILYYNSGIVDQNGFMPRLLLNSCIRNTDSGREPDTELSTLLLQHDQSSFITY